MSYNGDSLFPNASNNSNSAEIYADVPLYLKVLATIFYSISLLLGFGGNTLVLLIAFYYDRTRTVTNFFIINYSKNNKNMFKSCFVLDCAFPPDLNLNKFFFLKVHLI